MNLSKTTKAAIYKYGSRICLLAYEKHINKGYGANTIGWELGMTTRQADAAINAGRELAAQ